ncbi:MAG TPA: hotdog domain-containing protein [Acidimicrobiia bacterium]|nr:hotdog domain-containing protein [Acidimicrobiia bacterium]
MQTPLPVGSTHTTTTLVGPEHTPAHLAPLVVLSTPDMIRLMEEASTAAVQSLLEREDKTTVGVHIDVSHESAARQDEEVAVEAELVTVDGPRLTFRVEARCGDRVIGRGTHRRYVVDRSRFAR